MEHLFANHQEVFPGEIQGIKDMVASIGCDINEHVPTLIEYGRECNHITEMGVRFGFSTRSFLFSRPQKLVSVDLYEWNSIHQAGCPGPLTTGPGNTQYKRYRELYKDVVDHKYILGNSTKVDIEPTDLLFIDTFHHGDCLTIELEKHADKAQKYIILHDTETFGRNGQEDPNGVFTFQGIKVGPGTGLRDALERWLPSHQEWIIYKHFTNNNGLTILKRQ